MALPLFDPSLDHPGLWTEEEYLALPEDRRIELLDGELLVRPSARHVHQRISLRLAMVLHAAAPPGFEVLEAINVRVGPGRLLIPDLAVITTPDADVVVSDAADVAMVVEIVSPGSVVTDRAIKPRLYAEAGVATYLRVESAAGGPVIELHTLLGDRYAPAGRAVPGERLMLTAPFAVEIDPKGLVSR